MSNTPLYLSAGIKNRKLPRGLLALLLGLFFLSSGVHYGLIVLGEHYQFPVVFRVLIPVIYWFAIAFTLTIFTRQLIKKVYEKPLRHLAEATAKVASGDFTISMEPLHSPDKYDCLDAVILDFNRMVEELNGMETMKTDFISNVSHEFKTPIAVIQNNAEYLHNTDCSDTQKECIDAIYTSSKRLSRLVTNILRLSKLENQSLLPRSEEYDVCAQLAQCAAGYIDIIEKKDIAFEAEMEDSAIIRADPSLMELVWNNLLSNAVKFTDSGTITIRQYRENGNIYISVSDTGCGMSEETRKHMFDKFYQADSSHSTAGNGLGLTLVKKVVSLHGFAVDVNSEQGKGSEFTVIISG